jgi:hypothetical protein
MGVGKPERAVIRVRPMAVKDFEFVRDLASRAAGFTIPPSYVLWKQMEFDSALCAVADEIGSDSVAYLLASRATVPVGSIFVWQLGSTVRGLRLGAPVALVQHLAKVCKSFGVDTIFFTTIPGSAQERLVCSLAKEVFGVSPKRLSRLPASVSPDEYKYRLPVKRSGSQKRTRNG